jgi:glucuronoarabinoxylan endo-1,4-beta-xylanase
MRTKSSSHLEEKHTFFVAVLLCLFQTVFSLQAYSQTAVVNGRVTTSRGPVQYASVIFEDENDTTRKFSASTDWLGSYQLDIILTSVGPSTNLPTKFELEQNYPNPFSSSTAIPYELKTQSDIQATIYDILGRIIRKFNVGQQSIGLHSVLWDGRNSFGKRVASGVYFYRLSTYGESLVRKMIFNQNANGLVSLPHSYSSIGNSFSGKASEAQNVHGITFTIRVENTSTTTPVIIAQELKDVVIQDDTTINLSVDYFPTASIDFDSLYQIISGFGGANLFFLGRPDMSSSEVETAFGTGDGQLGFSILRIGIDPNTGSWRSYVATSKKAYDMGAKIIASAWTPPASMKTNNSEVGGELKESSYADYAAYLKSFGDFMADSGISLYAISPQNEPDANVGYQSCDWSATQLLNFCKNNAQSVGYRIMMPESQGFVHALSDPTLNDSVAAANVSIIAGHIYGGGGSTEYPLAESKGKEVWMTEYLINSGNPPTNLSIDTGWTGAMQTALSINNCMKASMSAYVWWYIVRYYGPIADGTYAAKGAVTEKGYVMSQFARFVRPGFYRVESSIYPVTGGVDISAYKDPSSSKVVIVAINTRTTQAETVFRIQNGVMPKTFVPYTTSESKNCEKGNEFDITSDYFTLILDPSSITTFVSN